MYFYCMRNENNGVTFAILRISYGKYDMWQYFSTGTIQWISVNVDFYYLYRELGDNLNSSVSTNNQTVNADVYNENSIVDYLKSINVDSSFKSRKKLAKENGIGNYIGSAKQNVLLLNMLRNKTANNLYKIASKYM